ncbi:MAG TPA: hypothetical protein VFH88_14195 [Candidatus Krumholzibacteria bacterium]|nr:hypothetical protein [Candidatus Krumholzibacteria bacterium]
MFALIPALSLFLLSAQPAADPCPAASDAWIELSSLPDSLLAPPQFFFDQPTVPLEGLIVCPHGVFFNFHAMQDSVSTEYYISAPVPTHEEYVHYVPPDTALSRQAANDPHYVDHYVDRQVAANTVRLNQLKDELRKRLGKRYVEGQRIDLTGDPAKMKLGFPLKLLWGEETLPFYTYPGIYWRK